MVDSTIASLVPRMSSGKSSKWRLTCEYTALGRMHWAGNDGGLGVWMAVIQWDRLDATVVLFMVDKHRVSRGVEKGGRGLMTYNTQRTRSSLPADLPRP